MTSIAMPLERRSDAKAKADVAPPLPYGRVTMRIAQPLRRGFRILNRMMVPALRAGLGVVLSNPASGYLMVLTTHGRRTGSMRAVPLAYVIVDGALYCCAGFGAGTSWYRNVLADPNVAVTLPGRTLAGVATPVTDPAEWARGYRALISSMRLLGRLTVGDIRDLDDATLVATHGGIPLVRVQPTSFIAGQLDPRSWFWLVPYGSVAIAIGARVLRRRRRR